MSTPSSNSDNPYQPVIEIIDITEADVTPGPYPPRTPKELQISEMLRDQYLRALEASKRIEQERLQQERQQQADSKKPPEASA